jgi:hypothetical protein
MPDKRQPLPPERLHAVLEHLNEVLAEAERLRDEITRQIDEQHRGQQQHLSNVGKKKQVRRKR